MGRSVRNGDSRDDGREDATSNDDEVGKPALKVIEF